MSKQLVLKEEPRLSRIEADERINVGDWYWAKLKREDRDSYDIISEDGFTLMCVSHVGSNFATLKACSEHGLSETDIHLDNWCSDTRKEPNWKDYVKARIDRDMIGIQGKMKSLSDKASSLHLHAAKESSTGLNGNQSFLPSTYVTCPKKYKKQLIVARDKDFPKIQEDIKALNSDLAIQTRNLYLPDILKMKKLKGVLGMVEDKLFTIELYVGFNEEVCQIKTGKPAPAETPISIRQLVLYMDEETLFNYKSGGMDFEKLSGFDKWITKKKNLNRILPEERGIVAMRIRRRDKDYGPSESFWAAWDKYLRNQENKQTYLLIRNGSNVFRIATDLSFAPRLIPMRDELNKPLTEEDRHYSSRKRDFVKTSEVITPDDIRYDGYVLERMRTIKQYNRIILILQGLIDRTSIFSPMPNINLASNDLLGTWVNIIRDEESLPAPPMPFKEYRLQLNKTLRKGKVAAIGAYQRDTGYGGKAWERGNDPYLYEVQSVKRDNSAVKISFPHVYSDRSYSWSYELDDRRGTPSGRTAHRWVPIKYVMNVTDYNLGDYKMFLCNHAAKGEYLEWAKYLLTAEEYHRGNRSVDTEEIHIAPRRNSRW